MQEKDHAQSYENNSGLSIHSSGKGKQYLLSIWEVTFHTFVLLLMKTNPLFFVQIFHTTSSKSP